MNDVARPEPAPLVLLVHGAWHGAWCWAGLQARLDQLGVASMAIDLPGHGVSTLPPGDLYGDAQHVADVVHALDRPVVLVGHSYGGAVITEAAVRAPANVVHLVYLTAFAIDEGESIMGFLRAQPPAPVALSAAMQMRDDGSSVLDPDAATPALYGTSPAELVPAALARLCPQPMVTFTQPATGDPRATIASTYVVCSRDQAIAPLHQQALAARCTTSVTFDTDHSPFLSMPDRTAELLAATVHATVAG
jgi:pimeloyl-ACP methyl ester carboxylesterase